MPITKLFWSPGRPSGSRDRHVLRTEVSQSLLATTPNLAVVPEVGDPQWAEDYLALFTDVEFKFRPLFRTVEHATTFSGFGIHVDKMTGSVWCDPGPPPENAPRNFLIEIAVAQNVGGRIAPADIAPLLIRVHLHDKLEQILLTPAELTIHRENPGTQETTQFRFTALAEFDDGTAGDVTQFHGLTWSTLNPLDEISADGFITLVPTNVAGLTFEVRATSSVEWGSLTAEATVRVEAPWSAATVPPKAILVDGAAEAWTMGHTADRSANVLFLGTGFPSGDPFPELITAVCHCMKRDSITRPYDLLADTMSFWQLQSPSTTRGISILCEVEAREVDGRAHVIGRDAAVEPPLAGTTPWTVRNLFYAVGLPVPGDLPMPGSVNDTKLTAQHVADLRTQFSNRALPEFVIDILDTQRVPDTLITEWWNRRSRKFVEQVDSFPALAIGLPPSVDEDARKPLVDLHPDRGGLAYLQRFLRTVVAENGTTAGAAEPLGVIWVEDRPTFTFDNRALFVITGASTFGRSNHASTHVNLVMKTSSPVPVKRVLGQRTLRLDVNQDDLPFSEDTDLWRLFAHELSHAHLDDEYVEHTSNLMPEDDRDGTRFDKVPNLLSITSVLAPVTEPDFTKRKISGELIKWRWPRIRRAAVIDGLVTEANGRFTVPVKRGHAVQFTAGDKVRFRSRTPKVPLKRFQSDDVSYGEFVVVSIATGVLEDTITVSLVAGAETLGTLGRFRPGSLLFQPVDPPSTIPRHEYPYAELLTENIRRAITITGESLTGPCDAAFESAHGDDVQIPIFDGSWPLFFSRRNNPRAVGLYSGSRDFACGAFHPTGFCMMRNHAEKKGASEFCVVCQYVLVDMYDPTRHANIEITLARRNFE